MFTRTSRNHIETKPRFVLTSEEGAVCVVCGDDYPIRRRLLGYDHCLACSSERPKTCNFHMHKQAPTYSHNIDVIRENQYGAHK